MKRFRILLPLVLLLGLLAALAAPAGAADYADGDYTVAFEMEGLGRHNVAWSAATVHVEGGALYVDFTVERVDPRNHAPQYDWVQTSLGTVTPILNDETFTATFLRVPVPNLGRVEVSAQTSGMSAPVIVEYVLNIDGSSIPAAGAPEPTPEPTAEPTPEPTVEPTPEPTAEPTPEPTAEPTPEPTAAPTEAPKAKETQAPAADATPIPTTGAATAEPAPAKGGLGVTGYVLIAVAAVVVIGGGIVLGTRKKK